MDASLLGFDAVFQVRVKLLQSRHDTSYESYGKLLQHVRWDSKLDMCLYVCRQAGMKLQTTA